MLLFKGLESIIRKLGVNHSSHDFVEKSQKDCKTDGDLCSNIVCRVITYGTGWVWRSAFVSSAVASSNCLLAPLLKFRCIFCHFVNVYKINASKVNKSICPKGYGTKSQDT